MKTPETLDVTLQAAILALGRALSSDPPINASLGRSASHVELTAETERVLSLVRASPARRLIGIRQGFVVGDDMLRLKTVALIGWQMIGQANSCNMVDDVVRAVLQGDTGLYCERLLIIRDAIARMVCDGLLTIAPERGECWEGRLLLPARTYSWLCGGRESKGDFIPSKILVGRLNRSLGQDGKAEAVPLRVPTAKDIFEAVRRDVAGLDPQIKVLASRIALHVARAELLKSGAQDHAVGNAVVLLAGASGSGKSFLAERTAAAAALPFCQVDCTTLTASGYVGSDVDEIYKLLVNAAGGDAVAASRGLCFLDEFDKKSARYARGGLDCRDVSALAPALIPLLQPGETLTVLNATGVAWPELAGRCRIEQAAAIRPHRPGDALAVGRKLALRRQWRRLAPTVTHLPYCLGLPPRGGRLVLTVHDTIPLDLPTFSSWRTRLFWRLTMRRALRRADALIAVSQATLDALRRHFPEAADKPARVIRHGIDARFTPPTQASVASLRARLSLPPRFALFLGSDRPHKNLATLLAAQTGAGNAALPLVVAGMQSQEGATSAAARSRTAEAPLRWLGAVTETDLPILYGAAEALLLPSLAEGFGLPLLEALACGTRVVAADLAVLRELVGDGATFVAPTDVAGWHRCLGRLSELPRLAPAARTALLAPFTWERAARETLEVYRAAASLHQQHRAAELCIGVRPENSKYQRR